MVEVSIIQQKLNNFIENNLTVNYSLKPERNHLQNLAADGLLVLLAAFVSTLVRLDAQTGAAPGARGLAGGAGGFLFVLEQLHQQVELETGATLQLQKKKQAVDGDEATMGNNLKGLTLLRDLSVYLTS